MQEVAQTTSTVEVINQFNDAFNRHDVQAVNALKDKRRFATFGKSFFVHRLMLFSSPRR
jgi:hypothetical protein